MDRVLTTHTGSLARPAALEDALARVAIGELTPRTVAADVREAVDRIVARQVEVGLDIVNDGEMGKTGFFGYVSQRLSGFENMRLDPARPGGAMPEAEEFPEWAAAFAANLADANHHIAITCVGDVAYTGTALLEADVENLRSAQARREPKQIFMTAASPGLIAHTTVNQHFARREDYLGALSAAMKVEYDAIHAAGFILQLDCPDLASWGRTLYPFPGATFDEWRDVALLGVEALNDATRDIPPEAMRMHVCWGNYAGPHTYDVGLGEIVDILFRARPAGLSIEAANPRHAHEWSVFEDVDLPDGKFLIPGVVDSTSNFVEHPDLVAQRIESFARVVGRENVVAGTDCGFATLASWVGVDPEVSFAKLGSVVEGAVRASARLWR